MVGIVKKTGSAPPSYGSVLESALPFSTDPDYENVVLLINADSVNGSQNNTFIDSSDNNFTMTRVGNTTQGTFTPWSFQEGYWSTHFDASADILFVGSSAGFTFGSDSFTLEGWFYFINPNENALRMMWTNYNTWGANSIFFGKHTNQTGRVQVWINNYSSSGPFLSDPDLPNFGWMHYAVVRNGNDWTLFRNGVAAATINWTGSATNGTACQIGGNTEASGGYCFYGYIHNFRIVKGTAVYTSNFPVPTSLLEDIPGTSVLACQSSRHRDVSSNNLSITTNGEPRCVGFTPFNYKENVYNSENQRGSGYFDGGADYLDSPANSAFNLTNEFTIECWYYQTGLSTAATVFEIGTYINGILFRPSAGTNGSLWINNVQRHSSLPTRLGAWNHMAVTRDSSDLVSYYINGERLFSGTITGAVNSTGALIRIGTSTHTTGQHHTGYITDLRIVKGSSVYDPNLTAITIPVAPLEKITNTVLLLQFANAGIIDQTNNNNIETLGNAQVSTTVTKYRSGSIYFDGTSDYLVIPNRHGKFIFGVGNFTIETWVYLISMPSGNGYPASYWLFGGGLVNSNTGFDIAIGSTNLQIGVTNFAALNINVAHGMTTETWYHIAVVRSGATLYAFKDGVQLATADIGTTFVDALATGVAISAGEPTGATSGTLNGYIDDYRITKGVARYTSNFASPTSLLDQVDNVAGAFEANTTVYLRGNSLDGANNDQFVDTGLSVYNVTVFSKPVQGDLGPYIQRENRGSYYFDGNDSLRLTTNAAFELASNDFCIECWVFLDNMPTSDIWPGSFTGWMEIVGLGTASTNNGWQFRLGTTQMAFGTNLDTTSVTATHGMSPCVWYHVAVSRETNLYRLFVNGVLIGSATYTDNEPGIGAFLWIGSETGQGAYLRGYISNLRIIKGAAVRTSAFSPPTTPLDVTAQTSLLTCRNRTLTDESANSFVITRIGDTVVAPLGPFTYDRSYQIPANSGSAYFDGTDDYLSIPSPNLSGVWTVEFWMLPTLNTTQQNPIAFNSGSTSGISIFLNTSDQLVVTDGVTSQTAFTTVPVRMGSWNHIAIVRDGTNTTSGYINGRLAGTNTFTPATVDRVFVGRSNAATGYFRGFLSNVRVVNGTAIYTGEFTVPTIPVTAISNTSLLLNFKSAGIVDEYKSCNVMTVNNSRIRTNIKKFGSGSINFGNPLTNNGYLLVYSPSSHGFNLGTGNFTIEFYFYMFAVPTSTQIMFDTRPQSTNGAYHTIYIASGGSLRYYTSSADRMTSSALVASRWYHVAVSRSGTSTRLFINGLLIGDTYVDTSNYSTPFGRLVVGGDGNSIGNNIFNGNIDNLRITKGIARYTTPFIPPGESQGPTSGEVYYTVPGTYSWMVPAGVTEVDVICVGGGGGGATSGATVSGGNSSFDSTIVAFGGTRANDAVGTVTPGVAGIGGAGGGFSGGTSGGFGGAGGSNPVGLNSGGGAAAGYGGPGGQGANGPGDQAGSPGLTGGGGGGGTEGPYGGGGGGGGVGLFGQGLDGGVAGGWTDTSGKGGSGGNSGGFGWLNNVPQPGGFAGGGAAGRSSGAGGGGLVYRNNYPVIPGNTYTIVVGAGGNSSAVGANGAVRILWGSGRDFPTTNVGITQL